MAFRPKVVRKRAGEYVLRLSRTEREVLRSLPGQLRELLENDDPSTRRLFPPAYADDAERNEEFDALVREELVNERVKALELMEETIDADRLDEEQIAAWLGVLNDVRLVLGTMLDVTEEMYDRGVPRDDPRAEGFELYLYLGWLQEQVVASMAAELEERPARE